jgi:hypothetical protein
MWYFGTRRRLALRRREPDTSDEGEHEGESHHGQLDGVHANGSPSRVAALVTSMSTLASPRDESHDALPHYHDDFSIVYV